MKRRGPVMNEIPRGALPADRGLLRDFLRECQSRDERYALCINDTTVGLLAISTVCFFLMQ